MNDRTSCTNLSHEDTVAFRGLQQNRRLWACSMARCWGRWSEGTGAGDERRAGGGLQVETIYLGDRRIQIRTSVLEDKSTACNMLCCYADELRQGFLPWVNQVPPAPDPTRLGRCTQAALAASLLRPVRWPPGGGAADPVAERCSRGGGARGPQVTGIMVPLLKFYFHEDVRLAAVQSLPELLRSAVLAVEGGLTQDASLPARLLDFVWQPLLDALHKVPPPAPAHALLPAAALRWRSCIDGSRDLVVRCCIPSARGGTAHGGASPSTIIDWTSRGSCNT